MARKSNRKGNDLVNNRFGELLGQLSREHKEAAAAKDLNQALVSSIGDGVYIINEYGVITQINSSALQMLGYEEDELLNKWLPEVLPSQDKDGHQIPTSERQAMEALLTGRPISGIISYTRKDGSNFPVAATSAPFILNNKPRGAIVVFRDFSRETAVEKAKDEFVSLASHQMRTPLTSIMLYTKMIKEDSANNLNAELREHLNKIERATIGMLELIGDFLNLSKLELGRLSIKKTEVDLNKLLATQFESLKPVLNDNKIKLAYSKPAKAIVGYTDVSLLSQAVHNLLTNAVRYRSHKNPIIKVGLKQIKNRCLISISDNGIGIPAAAQDKVFMRLYRAENAIDTHEQGTGLGLYLVKKIIEETGGNVWFESKQNAGTTFYVEIPAK